MHSATQIIAQRAPPASRTTKAARWQPYYAIQSTSSNLQFRSPHINTHTITNVSSPKPPLSSHCQSSIPDLSRSRPPISSTTAQTPKETPQRDNSKHKFAVGLIDQAVHILSDIWRPHDVPAIFLAPVSKAGGSSFPASAAQSSTKTSHPNAGASTVVPPSTSTQPPPAEFTQTAATPTAALALLASGTDSDQAVLPLKTFVHEVLRRSRTSGNVLQTALCYLEAIRPKVPEVLQQEKVGIRAYFQPESRIQPATQEELEQEVELCAIEAALESAQVDDSLKTVRVTDCGPEELEESQICVDDLDTQSLSSMLAEPSVSSFSSCPRPSSSPSSSYASLPSPLLCPRRAFLASLILASKFSQDKCYSNRAWAKLSGLPPREIGRCERALGQALQWRLWVGKSPVGSQTETATAVASVRAVARSQSEGSVVSPTLSSRAFMSQEDPAMKVGTVGASSETPPSKAGGRVGLRRCSTLPVDVPTPSTFQPSMCSSRDVKGHQDDQDMEYLGDQAPSVPLDTKSSPATPGLSYSPSSTDSSGDRTVQMSTLEDNMYSSSFNGISWLNTDSVCRTASPLSFVGNICRYDSKEGTCDPVSVVDADVATFGPNYMWNTDTRYILEPAGVH